MNIIIPLGGRGERFVKEGYARPKALIDVFDKTMIEHAIDHLDIGRDDKLFIFYNKMLEDFGFLSLMETKYPHAHLIRLPRDTQGAAETLQIGIGKILEEDIEHCKKTILLDCDVFYTEDVINIFRKSENGMVFYTKKTDEKPIYSYIELDNSLKILDIAEKRKISDNANCGVYAFMDINELHTYCNKIVDEKIFFNNEPYTSCVISEMLKSGTHFTGYELNEKSVFSLGTPVELKTYIEETHAFLFDLDGTLVTTDNIYFHVWYEILSNYNITLTPEIFKKYIQGNNDKYVLNSLLSNINVDLHELSLQKDRLFLNNLGKIRTIDGVQQFIEKIYSMGHKIAIVTNCNRIVADAIIKHIHIDKYIDFIIASGDTENAKPSPEPYLKAMDVFQIASCKCIVFEDSKSGILSGKSANPKCLIGLDTSYTKEELECTGVDICLSNFYNIDMDSIFNFHNMSLHKINKYISDSLPFLTSDIIFNSNKLKGGFIADVNEVTIVKETGERIEMILKIENKNETDLSRMANALDLYEREYYFYDNVSKYVNIPVPKYYGLVKDGSGKNIGVLLENLFKSGNYAINLNLNETNIDISLKIIDSMAKFHAKFWNKNNKKIYPALKTSMDPTFSPTWYNFISSRWPQFKEKWGKILKQDQLLLGENIISEFNSIQKRLSMGHSTIIHGDIKSPNIFYNIDLNHEPCFIDWQHIAIGKGTQDLIFFIIESFDINTIPIVYQIFINYYYRKLREHGVENYTYTEYKNDLYDSLCYVPFFTAVWFGTVSYDDLIDKNFPYFFIQKLFSLL